MRFWILERRQQVLTADEMTAEELRKIVGELDDEQRMAELNQARLRAIVINDLLTITAATAEIEPSGAMTIVDNAERVDPPGPDVRNRSRAPALVPNKAQARAPRLSSPAYPCRFCDRGFGWAPGRASHERTAHPNEVAERQARREHPAGSVKPMGPRAIVQKGGKQPPNPPRPARVVATPPGPPPSNGKSKWRGVEEQPSGTMAERLEAAKRKREAGLA